MNTSRYLAIAAIATLAAAASTGALAAEGIASGELGNQSASYMPHHASSADRGNVENMAPQGNVIEGEAGPVTVDAYRYPSGSASRIAVHNDAVQAEHQGTIARGEG